MSTSARSSAASASWRSSPCLPSSEKAGTSSRLSPEDALVPQRDVGDLQLLQERARTARRPVGSERGEHALGERLVHVRRLAVEEHVRERRPDELGAATVPDAVGADRRRRPHLREVGSLERSAVDDHGHVREQALRLQGRETRPARRRCLPGVGRPSRTPSARCTIQASTSPLSIVSSRLASAVPLERADRPDPRLRDPLVEDIVVDVADEDAVALGIRRRTLDRRLAAEERRHLRVLHDLAAEAEPEILGQHVRRVRHETGKLGWRSRGSGASPLVAVRVRIRARLPLRGKRVGGGCRPCVQVVLARMAVQVDQAGEKEILRAGADDARTRRPRHPPAEAGLAKRRRSARCAQGRGRVGSRCARRPS